MGFREKFLRAPGVVEVAGRQIKRYHVNGSDYDIEQVIQRAAYAFLPRLLPSVDQETPPAGFVVLHRNRLLGCDDEDPANFRQLSRPWIGCVWELAPFGHERSAWVRHVLEPDPPDLDGYLTDSYPEGLVGGPR